MNHVATHLVVFNLARWSLVLPVAFVKCRASANQGSGAPAGIPKEALDDPSGASQGFLWSWS